MRVNTSAKLEAGEQSENYLWPFFNHMPFSEKHQLVRFLFLKMPPSGSPITAIRLAHSVPQFLAALFYFSFPTLFIYFVSILIISVDLFSNSLILSSAMSF